MRKKNNKTSEELEQELTMQLELLRRESEEWLKVGAVVAVAALLTYGIVKATRKKKTRSTDRAIEVLEKEGLLNEDIKKRLIKPNKSTFWPSMGQRLLIMGLALAKDKLFTGIFTPSAHVKESEEGR